MEKTRIAILGAGYGGIAAAKALYKRYKKDKNVEITVYDKNSFHTLMTELHEVAGGRCEPESVRIPLAKVFGGRRIKVVIDRVNDCDFENKQLKTSSTAYDYDYLILGPGAEPEYFGIPGAAQFTLPLWSYDDALKVRRHIQDRFLQASREFDPIKRKALLTFVVAGAGFTGIEMLGELLEWKKALSIEYHVDEQEVSVVMVEAMTDILPTLPKKLREKAMKRIVKMGGQVRLNTPISEVTAEGFKTKDGTTTDCGTLIWTCGVKGCAFAGELNFSKGKFSTTPADSEEDKNLRFNIKKKSRLLANEFMQSVDYDNVYLVGDVLWFTEKNRTLPQIVETALQTGECAAHNIISTIEKKDKKAFKSNYHGFMVSIGGGYAVANLMGVMFSGFFAMAFKHLVNLHYLWTVAGLNTCWGYLKHHFLSMPHDRSIIGSHASAKTPSYWLLPLRLYVGVIWALQGLEKVLNGWLNLGEGSKSGWMFSKGVIQAGTGVDAAAAATSESVGDQVVQTITSQAAYQGPDVITAATGGPGADAAAGASSQVFDWFKFLDSTVLKPDFFLVAWTRWFLDHFVSLFHYGIIQYGITFFELGMGLAIMGGFLTFPFAAASIGLCIMFVCAGFLTWSQLWLLFAGIALLGGAGKVAGLDYWIMPLLQKWWNKRSLAKRTYLYLDEPLKSRKKGR